LFDALKILTTPPAVSAAKISKAEDKAMEKSASKARPGPTGISIRNGPVNDAMDIDSPNGAPKRKSRSSIGQAVNYKDESDSDEGAPLVCPYLSRMSVAVCEEHGADSRRPNAKSLYTRRRRLTVMMSQLLRGMANFPPPSRISRWATCQTTTMNRSEPN
jgi:DNA topoisomerase-1